LNGHQDRLPANKQPPLTGQFSTVLRPRDPAWKKRPNRNKTMCSVNFMAINHGAVPPRNKIVTWIWKSFPAICVFEAKPDCAPQLRQRERGKHPQRHRAVGQGFEKICLTI
jgi:hypothetical protein